MNLQKAARLAFIAGLFLLNNGTIIAQDMSQPGNPIKDQSINQAVTSMLPSETDFMMVGLTTFGFINQSVTTTGAPANKTNSLADADRFEFSPMFLWRHGDNLLVEFEPSWDGNSIGVNWADVHYFIAPGLIARAGYFVLPFGIYNKRLAAGWIDKLPSDPTGMDVAGSDFGIGLSGGLPLGTMKMSYDVSLTNGFQLNNDGTITNGFVVAQNNGKTVCGRLGFLPLSNSSLEIGVSGLYGALATPAGATFINTNPTSTTGPSVSMYAVDLDFVHNYNPVQVNVKAQYSATMISSMTYADSAAQFTFNNTITDFFGQVSVRPSNSKNKYIKNLELAYRFVDYTTPQGSSYGQNYTESDIALDYWISWRTVLKLGYEMRASKGTAVDNTEGYINGVTTNTNKLIIQFSTEF